MKLYTQEEVDSRVIVELTEVAKIGCPWCGKKMEFAVHPYEPDIRYHNGEDRGFIECCVPEIHDRIEQIKKNQIVEGGEDFAIMSLSGELKYWRDKETLG